jgi:hypothetical protein
MGDSATDLTSPWRARGFRRTQDHGVMGMGRGPGSRKVPSRPERTGRPAHSVPVPRVNSQAGSSRRGHRQRLTDLCPCLTYICMRTTLDVEDRLLKAARVRAAREGTTLTAVVEVALQQYLAPVSRSPGNFKLELLTKPGRLLPGVNLEDRDALYEHMERDR